MPPDTGEKTEVPTPRRLQEAREKGQVAKSPDLAAAVELPAGCLVVLDGARLETVLDPRGRLLWPSTAAMQ